MKPLHTLKTELLADPATRAEYDALAPEFETARELVHTRTGRVLQLPAPEEDAAITAAAHADPDAVPLTDTEWAQVKPVARRGRPLGSGTKTQITLRLDADLVNEFKATGPGWQTRINALLRDAVERGLVKG